MEEAIIVLEKRFLSANAERNAGYFDTEMGKLEKWAQDVKTSLEIKLKQLDSDIKTRKTEARKILSLENKIKVHREIKEMEKKRSQMRMHLFQAQDDVDERKERLIEEIEARLNQHIYKTELFTIRWTVV